MTRDLTNKEDGFMTVEVVTGGVGDYYKMTSKSRMYTPKQRKKKKRFFCLRGS